MICPSCHREKGNQPFQFGICLECDHVEQEVIDYVDNERKKEKEGELNG